MNETVNSLKARLRQIEAEIDRKVRAGEDTRPEGPLSPLTKEASQIRARIRDLIDRGDLG